MESIGVFLDSELNLEVKNISMALAALICITPISLPTAGTVQAK